MSDPQGRVDLRSDTVTRPSPAMREAMMAVMAPVCRWALVPKGTMTAALAFVCHPGSVLTVIMPRFQLASVHMWRLAGVAKASFTMAVMASVCQ